jgi:hypothetical protein
MLAQAAELVYLKSASFKGWKKRRRNEFD